MPGTVTFLAYLRVTDGATTDDIAMRVTLDIDDFDDAETTNQHFLSLGSDELAAACGPNSLWPESASASVRSNDSLPISMNPRVSQGPTALNGKVRRVRVRCSPAPPHRTDLL
jgi:hypothetical protein